MAILNPKITLEFEPVVKLTCLNFKCVHNLAHRVMDPQASCNLKLLTIRSDGTCGNMLLKSQEDKKSDVSQ